MPSQSHPGGMTESRELAELRYHWGEAYQLAVWGGGWRAKRRDGEGGWILAEDPEALYEAIRADYQRDPVSRDVGSSPRAALPAACPPPVSG